MQDQRKLTGILIVLTSMLALSIAPTLIKFGISSDQPPMPLLSMRMIIAATILWIVFGVLQPQFINIGRKGLRAAVLVGLCNSISISSIY